MVIRMDALFLVDRDARKKQMTGEERLAARRQHAEVWADEIRQECVKLAATVLPKSALGKAITYTLNQWPKLRRCFDYGEVELSNNLAENSMRPVALGRKNWLHVGSAQSGPKVAAIISVVESSSDVRAGSLSRTRPPSNYVSEHRRWCRCDRRGRSDQLYEFRSRTTQRMDRR